MSYEQWAWVLPVLAGLTMLIGPKSQRAVRSYDASLRDALSRCGALVLVIWVLLNIAVSVMSDLGNVLGTVVGLAAGMFCYQLCAAALIFFPQQIAGAISRLLFRRSVPFGGGAYDDTVSRVSMRALGGYCLVLSLGVFYALTKQVGA